MSQNKATTDSQSQVMPDEAKLQRSVTVARKVVELQATAGDLKERAKKAVNPKERMKLLEQAYEKEIEAVGQSRYAKRLQSGAWQGAAAGGGIGGGVALGLGTVVGTLVSGLVSVPTVIVGGLVGAGVGGIHGPFLKFGNGKKAAMTEEEKKAEAMKEAQKLDDAVERGANTVPEPPKLEEVQDGQDENGEHSGEVVDGATQSTVKKKPRKLEVRSGNEMTPSPERRKPRKLEKRSGLEKSENE